MPNALPSPQLRVPTLRPKPIAVNEQTRQRVRAAKQYMYEYYVGWFK